MFWDTAYVEIPIWLGFHPHKVWGRDPNPETNFFDVWLCVLVGSMSFSYNRCCVADEAHWITWKRAGPKFSFLGLLEDLKIILPDLSHEGKVEWRRPQRDTTPHRHRGTWPASLLIAPRDEILREDLPPQKEGVQWDRESQINWGYINDDISYLVDSTCACG